MKQRYVIILFIGLILMPTLVSATLDELIQQLLSLNFQGSSGDGGGDIELQSFDPHDLEDAVEDALRDVPVSTDHALESAFLDDNSGVPPSIATRDEIRQFSQYREGEPRIYRRVTSRRRGEHIREAPRRHGPAYYAACGALATCGLCLAGMVIASQVLKVKYNVDDGT